MTLAEVLAQATHQLHSAGCDTPRLDAEVLLGHVLQRNRAWILAHSREALPKATQAQFLALTKRRSQREPVAYITGLKAFYGLDFAVDATVLIPRPETELLIETALEVCRDSMLTSRLTTQKANESRHIADVGTGSGCIAVTLATHLPQAHIYAIDVSPQALTVALRNAQQHRTTHRITWLQGSLLDSLPHPVDVIASNPPYVSTPELAHTSPEIQQYEPHLALDGGNDGLDIIRHLLEHAPAHLNPGGYLLVEIGAGQGPAVRALAQARFSHVTIRRDLAGHDRLLVAT